MHQSWQQALSSEFESSYFKQLMLFVDQEYQSHVCYPPRQQIFSALEIPFDDVKVVILGQDPYHGPNQAHGLCFSVGALQPLPPSLKNIFRELESDLSISAAANGNLERWSNQGVLMLNAVMTVRHGEAGSHANKGWEQLTDSIIKKISQDRKDVVFLLWGGYAKKKGALIDTSKHLILEAGHPSPLSANKGHWFGNKHFSKTNQFLESKKVGRIEW